MKKVSIALVVIVIVLAGALFWLRSNMDHLVKEAIEKYGSQMTGTEVEVSSVDIKASQGTGIIRGLVVDNPAGFKTPYALKVGKIEIVLDISTLTKPVVVIKKIAIRAPDVIYEKSNGTTNFDVIQHHIEESAGSKGESSSEKGGRKLIVGHLSIKDAKAQASAGFLQGRTVGVTLPDITLRNIGRDQGGVPPGELGREVGGALKSKLEAAVSFDALAGSMGSTLKKAGSEIKGLLGK